MSNQEDAIVIEISREDRTTLERLEEELWREEIRFDPQRMNELIANDFSEFGRSGRVYYRQEILAVTRQAINAIFSHPNYLKVPIETLEERDREPPIYSRGKL